MEPARRTVYLLTGSNIGDREAHLQRAIELIDKQVGQVTCASHVYETEPWGVQNQPYYLNQALEVQCRLSPHDLLHRLKSIERAVGRQPGTHMKPRILDIDILLFGNKVITSPKLCVPHPQLMKRNFAIIPLAEICPAKIHPLAGKTILALTKMTGDKLSVRKLTTV